MEFTQNPAYILAILFFNLALSEWLGRYSFFRSLGTALLVILFTAVWANLGLIPSSSDQDPVYLGIFQYLAPLSIFYLLLGVNLQTVRRAGAPMLIMFFIGASGTIVGVLAGMSVINGPEILGDLYPAFSGMFTGTYIGGGANFNALAVHFEVMQEGNLFAGAVAVDNIMTAIWMVATIVLPKILWRTIPRAPKNGKDSSTGFSSPKLHSEETNLYHLSLLGLLGLFTLLISNYLAD